MVLTILEAKVNPENWEKLEQVYTQNLKDLPSSIAQTYLVQNSADKTTWRILTLWQSREALEAMRKSGTPAGVLMFRAAGAEPTLLVFEVKASAQNKMEKVSA